jgi:hypothetical protein
MQIQRMVLSLLVVLVLGLAPLSYGQIAPHQPSHRIFGYYNPATGAFEPLRPAAEDVEPAAVTATTGTLVFKPTITVKSTIPKNGVIGCSGEASVGDSSGRTYAEHGSGVETLVSGTTYTCTVTLPYSWLLSSPASDKITLDYTANLNYGFQLAASNAADTAVEPLSARESDQGIPSISVPASGATTTEDVSVTL